MQRTLARAVEALLWPFGIRRKRPGGVLRDGVPDDSGGGELHPEDSGRWEVDPVQFIGAVTGACIAWWAIGRLKTLPATPALTSVASASGAGVGSGNSPPAGGSLPRLPLSEFIRLLRAGAVTAVTYMADRPPAGALLVKARPSLHWAPTAETLLLPGCHQGLFEELRSCDGVLFECAEVAAEAADEFGRLSLLIDAGGLLASVAALWYMLKGNGQGSGLFTGRHLEEEATNTDANRTAVTFDDVAGMETTKEELREVISFLRNPESFYALGARPPRGILLAGPSGTGKTLLARAVAGEAGVPFLYASSAAFVEIYVGQGAQRIRQFYEEARASAPCIVFLDELDAVGTSRQVAGAGGHQEYAQTLNQLLLELDGIESHQPASSSTESSSRGGATGSSRTVVTMAATNRFDCLDDALVRPGRLDRIVMVDLPNLSERVATLEIHARKLRTEGLNFEAIGKRTAGFSGAELANLLNEAALLAARRGAGAVSPMHVDEVLQNPRPRQWGQQTCSDSPPERDVPQTDFGAAATAAPEFWARMLAALAASVTVPPNGFSATAEGFRDSPEISVAEDVRGQRRPR